MGNIGTGPICSIGSGLYGSEDGSHLSRILQRFAAVLHLVSEEHQKQIFVLGKYFECTSL
jgi:hypothetical protein